MMAITVKHLKVSAIPDEADTSLVRPSDWNADHVLTGTIPIVNGGTGQTTANLAFNALAPSQTGNTGKYLTTDGTDTSWSVNPLGTVTSVAASGGTGISVSGSPITTSGTLTITNTAPDQTVAIASGTGISVTGTYPSFTVTNTSPSLGGDVVGPASATDNAIARFDTTTGKLIQNSIVTISDTGAVTGVIQENFTPVTPPTYLEGKVFYDSDSKTLAYYNDNSQMTVNIGQESIVRVRNQTGATIADGTVVYINGATGNTPTIAKAIATSFATSDIIGVTTTSILNNGFGYVTISGLVNGLDTSAFNEGDAVFLSATTAGAYTTTEPSKPNYSIQVGVILRANPSVGTLLVFVQFISTETQHIIGTLAVNQGGTGQTTYTNGQLLIGNTTGNTLTKSTLTAGTGVSVTNGTGSITIANTGVTSVTGTGTVSGISLSGTVTTTGSLTLGGTLDLSAPPVIGGTTPNTITGTTITATTGIFGGTF
jgi:hypothetical protein